MPRKRKTSGSPEGEPEYLVVGFLRRPHGLQGEILMDVHTGFPERLRAGRRFYIGEDRQLVSLVSTRPHQNRLLVKFKSFDSPEQVGRFRNQWVYIQTSEAQKLPKGQLYQHQLFGLKVEDDKGIQLGELVEIIETGANDVYVIRNIQGGEVLIPAIESVIQKIDLDRRIMRVHLLEAA
jgi:16S rRNA processing protein RimM